MRYLIKEIVEYEVEAVSEDEALSVSEDSGSEVQTSDSRIVSGVYVKREVEVIE